MHRDDKSAAKRGTANRLPNGARRGQIGSNARWCWAFCLVLALGSTGCMHRRMTVRSDPPGAMVLIDGEEIGYTPTSIDFTYYGTRELTLIKPGYKTLTLYQDVPRPWYQIFPLEFVTDNLALTKIRDSRNLAYTLQPEELIPTQEILDRANGLRSDTLRTEGR